EIAAETGVTGCQRERLYVQRERPGQPVAQSAQTRVGIGRSGRSLHGHVTMASLEDCSCTASAGAAAGHYKRTRLREDRIALAVRPPSVCPIFASMTSYRPPRGNRITVNATHLPRLALIAAAVLLLAGRPAAAEFGVCPAPASLVPDFESSE